MSVAHRDGTGNSVASGCDVPVFGGAIRSDAQLVRALDDALGNLAESPCGFWACKGATRYESMCTCRKCYAMREVAKVRAVLNRRNEERTPSPGTMRTAIAKAKGAAVPHGEEGAA